MRKTVQLALLLGGLIGAACLPALAAPNPRFTGAPYLRTWTAEDYGGTPVVGAIVQHPRSGYIYLASGARLFEFDGQRWRALDGLGGNTINSLAVDPAGRLWFSTNEKVGYLAPDAVGELHAVSALPRLPASDAQLAGLTAALATPQGVFFCNRHRIVCFGPGDSAAQVWRFDETELVLRLWLQEDAVHARGTGDVLRLANGQFRPVAGLRTAAFIARPHPAGGWQLAGNDGVHHWRSGYVFDPEDPAPATAFQRDLALGAAFLTDGRIAFGTAHGVVVCDRFGHAEQRIDRGHGLPSNRIESMCADREGGLWVGLRNGVARLQLDTPLARHGVTADRLDSSPSALAVFDSELYVGGGEGLWRRDIDGGIHAIADVPFPVRSLVVHQDRLYATGIELRQVIAGGHAMRIGAPFYGLVPISTASDVFAHGTNNGIAFERANGSRWTPLARTGKIHGPTTVLCEWPAGVVWGSNPAGIWRVDVRAGIDPDAPARCYTRADGLPPGTTGNSVELYAWGTSLGGNVAGRLVRFDPAADRFLPETRIAGLTVQHDGFVLAASAGARPASDGTLWLELRDAAGTLVRAIPEGRDHWRAIPAAGPTLPRIRPNVLLADPSNHTLWIGAAGLLLSRDLTWKPSTPPAAHRATIRRIETADGATIWADGNTFVGAEADRARLTLPPKATALRITYALPAYQADHLGRTHAQFRTRLQGIDGDWSAWRGQPSREFTNLPYRDFVFEVQGRDEDGRVSPVASLAFAITPPWWRSRWAEAAYGALGLLALAGVVRWRTRTLQRRTENLEAMVATRTEELRRSNAELARLHASERDEKLAARLAEEKARLEVLRYQLNPHFLFNALNSVCAHINHAPASARAMVVRLADFCRQTLRPGPDEAAMTVGQELAMLRSYLDIEKARLGELLEVEIETHPDAESMRIPPFLLLPLVENAVKYGSATSVDRVGIRLRVQKDDDGSLRIGVANTGEWIPPGAHSAPSTGIGLENLRQRLARYYPDAHEFATSAESGWVTVRVRLMRPMPERAPA